MRNYVGRYGPLCWITGRGVVVVYQHAMQRQRWPAPLLILAQLFNL